MKAESDTTIVIAGGGQAAGAAVLRLRQHAFAGRVVVITQEAHLPYERPPLSKEYLLGQPQGLRPIFGAVASNESVLTDIDATHIDLRARVVHTSSGAPSRVDYDRLLLATGARPRRLPAPGAELDGVHVLRTQGDAAQVRAALQCCREQERTLLVVGGSWIGLEVAASARALGIAVVLIEYGQRLCERTLPAAVAERLRLLHAAQGVDVRFGTSVTAFHGNGSVEAAELSDDNRIAIGAAVIGIGVVPNVELAAESGLRTGNGILVDAHGRTSDPSVFAAGDVAEIDCPWLGGRIRYECWDNANRQASAAVDQMMRDLGRELAVPNKANAPWFWSEQYGQRLQIAGLPLIASSATAHADDEDGFVESYHNDTGLVGAVALGHAREFRDLRRTLDSNHHQNRSILHEQT